MTPAEFLANEARDDAGRATSCIFAVIREILGLEGDHPAALRFHNARIWQRMADGNARNALANAEARLLAAEQARRIETEVAT